MNKALAGLVLLFGTSVLSPVVTAGTIDLALSDETANLQFVINSRRFYTGQEYRTTGGSELAFGGFINEDDDRLMHVSLMARGDSPSSRHRYSLSAGMKVLAGEVTIDPERVIVGGEDSERVGAVALGFQTLVLLSPSPRNPVEFGFEVFYAPSIASFSDAEQFSEVSARLQVDIIPQARAYVGYRRMSFDTNDYDRLRLDRSVHIGIEVTY